LPLLATGSPKASLTWSIGCLPVALLGLAPTRRGRLRLIPIGGLFALSIIVGSLLVQTDVTAVVGIVAVAAAAGVRTSRWYVTPLFGSAMVFTLLLFEDPAEATVRWRFNERVGETILGVAVAYFFGLVVPRIAAAHRPTLKGSP
jgi:hypothetical protein